MESNYLEEALKIYTNKLNNITNVLNKIEIGTTYVNDTEHKKLLLLQKEYCEFIKILINIGKENIYG